MRGNGFQRATFAAVFALRATDAFARGGHMASDFDIGLVFLFWLVVGACVAYGKIRQWLARK